MCHEEFDTMDALVTHKTTAHRRIQCTHCPDLKLVVDLNKHLRNMHGIEQNSMCEHCGQGNFVGRRDNLNFALTISSIWFFPVDAVINRIEIYN